MYTEPYMMCDHERRVFVWQRIHNFNAEMDAAGITDAYQRMYALKILYDLASYYYMEHDELDGWNWDDIPF